MEYIEITYRTEAYWEEYLNSIDRINFKFKLKGLDIDIKDYVKVHFDEKLLLHHYIDLTEDTWKDIFSPVFIFMTWYKLPDSFIVEKEHGDFVKVKITGIFLFDLSHLIEAFFKPEKKEKPKSLTYLMLDHNTGYYKIGKSISPASREKTLQSEKPTIEMILVIDMDIEKDLHTIFASKRIRGEWFSLTLKDVDFIKNLIN
jgi:hypothetical protein